MKSQANPGLIPLSLKQLGKKKESKGKIKLFYIAFKNSNNFCS